MPDHAHVLVGVPDGTSLSEVAARSGSGRYPIRAEEDFRTAAEYVLDNPVRAGFVERYRDYELRGSSEFTLEESRGQQLGKPTYFVASILSSSGLFLPVISQRSIAAGTNPRALKSSMNAFIVNPSPSSAFFSARSLSSCIFPIR